MASAFAGTPVFEDGRLFRNFSRSQFPLADDLVEQWMKRRSGVCCHSCCTWHSRRLLSDDHLPIIGRSCSLHSKAMRSFDSGGDNRRVRAVVICKYHRVWATANRYQKMPVMPILYVRTDPLCAANRYRSRRRRSECPGRKA